jgi:hypothetical protein
VRLDSIKDLPTVERPYLIKVAFGLSRHLDFKGHPFPGRAKGEGSRSASLDYPFGEHNYRPSFPASTQSASAFPARPNPQSEIRNPKFWQFRIRHSAFRIWMIPHFALVIPHSEGPGLVCFTHQNTAARAPIDIPVSATPMALIHLRPPWPGNGLIVSLSTKRIKPITIPSHGKSRRARAANAETCSMLIPLSRGYRSFAPKPGRRSSERLPRRRGRNTSIGGHPSKLPSSIFPLPPQGDPERKNYELEVEPQTLLPYV